MKWNAIIVDDEPLARKLIANLLESVQEIEIIGLYGTGKEAIHAINLLKPDVLFLDIQLKDMNGFNVLQRIKTETPLTIFVTAFDKYAIAAFDIFAFDYLLKPFTEERFYKSVSKALETFKTGKEVDLQNTIAKLLQHVTTNSKTSEELKKRIPVPYRNKTIFLDTEEINYVLASNYYVEIYTSKGKFVVRNSMSNILEELGANKFARIHRSSIVNLSFINELISSNNGEIDLIMLDVKKLRVSKGYRKEFLKKVGIKK